MKAKITMFLFAGIFFLMSNVIVAQEVLTATKVTQSRGVSEYVIPEGDVFLEKPVLSRGGCVVQFDNWTGFYVDIWVDKSYKGRLNPWEGSQLILPKGYTSVYCRTMGDTYQWSSEGECNEKFSLKLEAEDEAEVKTSDSEDF